MSETKPSPEALEAARKFINERSKPPLLHGNEDHQEWLRGQLEQWIPDLAELIESSTQLGRLKRENEELRKAANILIDYCEAHDWGQMPEPFDSINPLLKLLGRALSQGKGAK